MLNTLSLTVFMFLQTDLLIQRNVLKVKKLKNKILIKHTKYSTVYFLHSVAETCEETNEFLCIFYINNSYFNLLIFIFIL